MEAHSFCFYQHIQSFNCHVDREPARFERDLQFAPELSNQLAYDTTMILELHNDDGTKTTYFGVSDFNQRESSTPQHQRVVEVFINNRVEADFDDREFYHYNGDVYSAISEAHLNEEAVVEHIGDRLVEPGHEIIVGIPGMSAKIAYSLAELRRDPEIDAEDNLTLVGRPDPEFPPNDTSEVDE